ncbi:MAG TPA: GGDEF domain-containing protein [Pirellulales bacterium]|nr:GGDEF domain-containing protein [Pirellulales bacterium]
MSGSLLLFLLAVVAMASVAAGALAGWYLRAQAAPAERGQLAALPAPPSDPEDGLPASEDPPEKTSLEPERVRELLSRIQQLTESTAIGVGEHSSRVKKISEDLAALAATGKTPLEQTILSAATRLLEANECLQQELSGAREKLDEHGRLIEAHMTEARTDGLVGIPNRRAFDEEIARQCAALEHGGPGFSLVLLDIDHFKKFNDLHGHQAGDDVLKGVGGVLAEIAAQRDFVARYGGEEFAIIIADAEPDEGKATAQQVRAAVEASHFEAQGKPLRVTASLGVADACTGDSPETVIRRADEALYAAKKNGRNRAYYFDGARCHPVESTCTEAGAELLAAVKRELERKSDHVSDRRRQPRRPFPSYQAVAPLVDGKLPHKDSFRQVRCHDISPGGIAYLTPKAPEHASIVVALGLAPNVTYLTALITHKSTTQADGKEMYLVGCRFTGRLEHDVPDQVTSSK